ncbi:hypothetical protein C8Q80DRAFT_1122120 [Daedaleopsis nitida]|nr:hypothetical protein C8Q80DRAFT_1122120 [Daedaleopsis nitida]
MLPQTSEHPPISTPSETLQLDRPPLQCDISQDRLQKSDTDAKEFRSKLLRKARKARFYQKKKLSSKGTQSHTRSNSSNTVNTQHSQSPKRSTRFRREFMLGFLGHAGRTELMKRKTTQRLSEVPPYPDWGYTVCDSDPDDLMGLLVPWGFTNDLKNFAKNLDEEWCAALCDTPEGGQNWMVEKECWIREGDRILVRIGMILSDPEVIEGMSTKGLDHVRDVSSRGEDRNVYYGNLSYKPLSSLGRQLHPGEIEWGAYTYMHRDLTQ